MKWLIPILVISLFSDCTSEEPELDYSILEGEWHWDSSNVEQEWFKDWVFFDDQQNYYKYTYWNSTYLIESGYVENDQIFIFDKHWYTIDTINSDQIKLTIPTGEIHFYNRADYSWSEDYSYKKELVEWQKKDSLKAAILGSWKLMKSKYPIEMMNSSEVLTDFTLEFKADNSAIFYKNHDMDSSIEYGYKTRLDGIELERGCIVGHECPILELNDSSMSIMLDPQYWKDTLILQRIPE